MTRRTDVFAVLAWGLRSYAWVVVLFVVALGIAVPAALQERAPTYEASAQVGPTDKLRLPNLDAYPKVGETAFANVYGSEQVRATLGLKETAPLGPDDFEIVAAQDNLVFTIIGRAEKPADAKALADAAATQFVDEINKYTEAMGSFALTTPAPKPTEPVADIGGVTGWVLGGLAGLAAGVGAVALILLLRRPVVDTIGAEDAAGAPVFARMTLHGRRGMAPGMAHLSRRLLTEPTDMLLLVGPQNTQRDRYAITEELVKWLGRVRRVVPLRRRGGAEEFGAASLISENAGADRSALLVIDDASPVEVATRPEKSLTLLVVREGISQRNLREFSDQYLGGEDTAILLVSNRSQWRSARRDPKRRASTRTPAAEPQANPAAREADLESERTTQEGSTPPEHLG